ncbi:MAG: hypothetical protein WCW44_03825 [archaeon]|jgi:uncharacterized membrane protein YraQ (UPF0718 family)
MAKAKETQTENALITMLMNNLKDNFIGKMSAMIKEKIKKAEKMTIELALSMIFFLMAILFILGALMFFLREYFLLTYSLSFFATGVVAIIVSYVLYKFATKE